MNKISTFLLCALVALSVLALSACGSRFGNAQGDQEQVALAPYVAPDNSTENNSLGTQTEADSADAQDAQLAGDENAPLLRVVRGEYNGEVVAEKTVSAMAEVSGQVLNVTVNVGDRIVQGALLVKIDSTMLEAQTAQTLAVLDAAQSQLDQLLRNVDPADLAAAQAALNAANAAYNKTVTGADSEDLTIAQAQLRQAEAAVQVAQSAYNEVSWNPKIGMMPQSLQLQQATLQFEAAQAQYQKIANGAGSEAIAGAYAQVAQAQAQIARLQEGANPEQIRGVQAQVKQAEVALYMSQLQIDKSTIEAPMSGIVAQVNVTAGGMVGPGSPLIVLVSDAVEVNISVEELRLPNLAVGQGALISANAYPDRVFEGQIVRIAPLLNPQTRTVQVTIRPTEPAPELLPGMFTAVDLIE